MFTEGLFSTGNSPGLGRPGDSPRELLLLPDAIPVTLPAASPDAIPTSAFSDAVSAPPHSPTPSPLRRLLRRRHLPLDKVKSCSRPRSATPCCAPSRLLLLVFDSALDLVSSFSFNALDFLIHAKIFSFVSMHRFLNPCEVLSPALVLSACQIGYGCAVLVPSSPKLSFPALVPSSFSSCLHAKLLVASDKKYTISHL